MRDPDVAELARLVAVLANLVDGLVTAGPPPIPEQRQRASKLAQDARDAAKKIRDRRRG